MNADLVEASPEAVGDFASAKDEPNSNEDVRDGQDAQMEAS